MNQIKTIKFPKGKGQYELVDENLRNQISKINSGDSNMATIDWVNNKLSMLAFAHRHSYGEPYLSDEFSTGYGQQCNGCGRLVELTTNTDAAIGDSVFMSVNGVRTEFIVVHQGNPDSTFYDASCDGVWLLMKDAYAYRGWDEPSSNAYLDVTFFQLLHPWIGSNVKQAKIPYTVNGKTVYSGADGKLSKCFMLSAYEIGMRRDSDFPVDGVKLDYFITSGEEGYEDRLKCYFPGEQWPVTWGNRSIGYSEFDEQRYRVEAGEYGFNTNRWFESEDADDEDILTYVRPAMILPSPLKLDENNNIMVNKVAVSNVPVGTSVFMNVNGVRTEFIVVNQGNPDATVYDASCDGTWLLMKDIYEERAFDSTDHDYENSDIHSYLNNTFINLFDDNINGVIKQAKLPYRKGTGTSKTVTSGVNGLPAKVFLLSYTEVGFVNSSFAPVEGVKLSYFTGIASSVQRVAKRGNIEDDWWLRSPYTNNTGWAWRVQNDGSEDSGGNKLVSNLRGIRPAIVIESSVLIDENFNIVV